MHRERDSDSLDQAVEEIGGEFGWRDRVWDTGTDTRQQPQQSGTCRCMSVCQKVHRKAVSLISVKSPVHTA